MALLCGYLLTLLWQIVLPDVRRRISETHTAYARWGTVRGSGVWLGYDGLADSIERATTCLRPGNRVMVWTGGEFEKNPDWRNLGAIAGWFLPRDVTMVSGDDPARLGANVVLSDDTLGQPPLPDDWQCVYHEWAASLYRLMPGSGPDEGKYLRGIANVLSHRLPCGLRGNTWRAGCR